MLKEMSGNNKHSRTSEKDSWREMHDDTGQGSRKRKAKSNASMTGFKRRRKV